jgi:hypothetical protein
MSPRPALSAVLVLAAAALGFAQPALAQDLDPAELEALMTRSMELAEPGPEHERLAAMVGEWDVQLTMWAERGAEPVVLEATAEAHLILGGRFLMQTTTIPEGYFAAESISILGFDRRSEEFTLLGLDTGGTYWVSAQGPLVSANEAVLSGEDFDAVFDGTQEYDFVLRWEGERTFITQIIFKDAFHTGGGEPFMMVETVATRR